MQLVSAATALRSSGRELPLRPTALAAPDCRRVRSTAALRAALRPGARPPEPEARARSHPY